MLTNEPLVLSANRKGGYSDPSGCTDTGLRGWPSGWPSGCSGRVLCRDGHRNRALYRRAVPLPDDPPGQLSLPVRRICDDRASWRKAGVSRLLHRLAELGRHAGILLDQGAWRPVDRKASACPARRYHLDAPVRKACRQPAGDRRRLARCRRDKLQPARGHLADKRIIHRLRSKACGVGQLVNTPAPLDKNQPVEFLIAFRIADDRGKGRDAGAGKAGTCRSSA